MMPTNVAARMTLAADPGSLQGAVAAGILGCGPVILGTSEACAQLLEEAQERVAAGGEPAAVAADVARAVHASGGRLPGFGHPVHRPLDPRAERVLELADARGVSGPHVLLARHLRDAAAEAWGRPLTMNVSMPIAAVMLDLGFPSATVKAVPILARTAGLLAHLAEEQRAADRVPHGRARGGGGRVRAPAGGRAQLILAPEVETRPWAEQLALDDASYRDPARLPLRALAPSTGRSSRAAGFESAAEAGGLAEIARLPLTEKRELRETCTPENPIGAHLCVEPAEIVRIYSTSGTTGTPSYIPLTAGDLDNWVTGSARSYAASGVEPGQRVVSTYNAGAVRGGRGAGVLRPHRALPHPGRDRQHRAADARDRAARTRGGGAHAVVCRLPRRVGGGAGLRSQRARASSACSWRASPAAASRRFRAMLEEGWGASVTEAMGIGDIGVSLWGECEEQDGMHLGARGFVHAELIDPDGGAPLELDDGATGELVLTHLQHRAAPLLRFRTRDHVQVRTEPRAHAAAPARACAASAVPTTCSSSAA